MIIAIAGASGSGKTTLADALLRRRPGGALLSTDWYYRDLSHLSRPERDAVNFDHPDAADWDLMIEHLNELKSGRAVAAPRYDFATHTRVRESRPVGPSPAVVIEGIFALWHEQIRRMLDLALFVETANDVCLKRRTRRDVAERGRTTQSVEAQWRRHTLPMFRRFISPTRSHADLIVDGTAPTEPAVDKSLDWLRQTGGSRPR